MKKKAPTGKAPTREDALRNEAQVRKALVTFLKKYKRPPTVQELSAATGLSDKTVRQHRQRIPLGSGKDNIYQQLSPDVLLAIHARAVGYSHPAEKLLVVSGGKGQPSKVERHDYTEHYPPDPTSSKLWMQLVEGFTEKSEKKHTGEVGLTMKFNYVAPAAPQPEGGQGGN